MCELRRKIWHLNLETPLLSHSAQMAQGLRLYLEYMISRSTPPFLHATLYTKPSTNSPYPTCNATSTTKDQ